MGLAYSLSYTHKPPQRDSRVFSHIAKDKTSGLAYPLSYTRQLSQKVATIFHSLGDRVRCRFSRTSKPIDHLGGGDPEARLPLIDSADRDLECWPKTGSTFENMDTRVY